VRSDSMPMLLEIARNKGGVVGTHLALGLQYGLVGISLGIKLPSLPIYLVCHRDVQHHQKIRVMMDFLVEHMEPAVI
jgi:DNA-binding transcriptional LysR family regulator